MLTRSFRRAISSVLALMLGLGVWAAIPAPAFACSCMAWTDPVLESSREPGTAIFTGVPQGLGPDGVPVTVTRWFSGPEPVAVAMLHPGGFEDPSGASCGMAPPQPGVEWIFAAPRDESGRFGVHSCTPAGPVAEPSGQEMLARAQELFGPGSGPQVEEGEEGGDGGTLILVSVLVLAAVGVLGGAVLVVRSSRDGRPA